MLINSLQSPLSVFAVSAEIRELAYRVEQIGRGHGCDPASLLEEKYEAVDLLLRFADKLEGSA